MNIVTHALDFVHHEPYLIFTIVTILFQGLTLMCSILIPFWCVRGMSSLSFLSRGTPETITRIIVRVILYPRNIALLGVWIALFVFSATLHYFFLKQMELPLGITVVQAMWIVSITQVMIFATISIRQMVVYISFIIKKIARIKSKRR